VTKELDKLFFKDTDSRLLTTIKLDADEEHYGRGPNRFIEKHTSNHWFWLIFPIVPIFAGTVLTLISISE
jgi:hypothetical protein